MQSYMANTDTFPLILPDKILLMCICIKHIVYHYFPYCQQTVKYPSKQTICFTLAGYISKSVDEKLRSKNMFAYSFIVATVFVIYIVQLSIFESSGVYVVVLM